MDRSREFSDWISSIGLGRHVQTLLDNEISFDVLRDINEDELGQIGLPLGARKRLMKALVNSDDDFEQPVTGDKPAPANQSRPQRRLITVLFFDLAGSTALSNALDPEDLQEIIGNFQSTVANVISNHDGFIARYMGDGLLCYFGWPTAHEDSAVRAVQAAMHAQTEVAKLPPVLSTPLQARAGIATGNVVVGDLIGEGASEEEAIVGATPNLAARLQGIAEPGQVVVNETTRSLIGNTFHTIELEPVALKGFDQPQTAAVVTNERTGTHRFIHAEHREIPILGREHELKLLRTRWQQACRGEGQCVLLSGEAGIGKSRVVSALLEVENLQQHAIVLQCSPYHTDTALWPVIIYLREHLQFKPGSSDADNATQLHQFFGSTIKPDAQIISAMAGLLGIDLPSSYDQEIAPQERRRQILLAVLHWIESHSSNAQLIVLEDAHWIDPTTLELVQHILDQMEQQPVLLLITCRPENNLQLSGSSLQTQLSLNRLGHNAARQMIDELIDTDIPDDTLKELIRRSDGVPLYIEELARASTQVNSDSVPLTLQNGLMARLDALPHVRRIAQEAACIGRQFDFEVLESVSETDREPLKRGLDELVSSGLIQNTPASTTLQYRFRHALLRDSAYESLLRRERSQIHNRIAASMAKRVDPAQSASPDQVAIHYQLAENQQQAFAFWVEACKRAAESSAIHEALGHGNRALAALEHVPPGKQRDELEFQLQMSFGSAHQSANGFAVSETGAAFARAASLAEQLSNPKGQLMAQLNLWSFKHHSGDFENASTLVNRNFKMATTLRDTELFMQANHAAWTTGFLFKPLNEVQSFIETGLDSYDEDKHKLCWSRFGGHDPCVCGLGHGAWISWLGGYPDTATGKITACIAAARRSEHRGSELIALAQRCFLGYYSRDHDVTLHYADAVHTLSSEIKASAQVATLADLLSGLSAVKTGAGVEGLRRIESAIETLTQLNTLHRQSLLALIYGEALNHLGRRRQAIDTLQRGREKAVKTGEIRWKGELERVLTRLQLEAKDISPAAAEIQLKKSILHSDTYGDRMYRLRSIRDLAKILFEQGRKSEAYNLLHEDHKWFTEGRNGVDLSETEELLADLAP